MVLVPCIELKPALGVAVHGDDRLMLLLLPGVHGAASPQRQLEQDAVSRADTVNCGSHMDIYVLRCIETAACHNCVPTLSSSLTTECWHSMCIERSLALTIAVLTAH